MTLPLSSSSMDLGTTNANLAVGTPSWGTAGSRAVPARACWVSFLVSFTVTGFFLVPWYLEYDIMILSQWNKVSIWCRISPLSPPKIGIPKAAEAQCPFFAVRNQVDQGSALTPQGAHAADLQHVLGDFDGFAYGHQRWRCWNGFGLLSRVHPILIDFVKRFRF